MGERLIFIDANVWLRLYNGTLISPRALRAIDALEDSIPSFDSVGFALFMMMLLPLPHRWHPKNVQILSKKQTEKAKRLMAQDSS